MSAGAAAGAVVTSVVVFLIVLFAFLWYRRRQRRRYSATILGEKSEKPARAEDVLQRPDPIEQSSTAPSPNMPTFRLYTDYSMSSVNLPASSSPASYAATHGHHANASSPPFSGIPSDHRLSIGTHPNLISATFNPASPSISGLDLPYALPHDRTGAVNEARVSSQSVLHPEYLLGRKIRDDHRHSYNTTTTFSSDISGEVPMIVTPTHGAVKQVVGVAKAQFVRTPKHSISSMHPSLHSNQLFVPKPTSGVASTSRTPPLPASLPPYKGYRGDSPPPREVEETASDPFRDRKTPSPSPERVSPTHLPRKSLTPSAATFGDSGEQRWPKLVWKASPHSTRHDSIGTEAGSVLTSSDRSSLPAAKHSSKHSSAAQSMLVPSPGGRPHTPPPVPSSPTSRNNMAVPVSARRDTLTVPSGPLESQQRLAMEGIQAGNPPRLSVMSSTSSIAESLLSAFPFVPPSPVGSFASTRTPPCSPLAQQAFARAAVDKASSNNSMSNLSSSLTMAPSTSSQAPGTPKSAHPEVTPPSSPTSKQRMSTTSDQSGYPLFLTRKVDKSRLSRDGL